MKLIFGSSPLRGDIDKNTEIARRYAKYIMDAGHSPVMPHLFFTQILDDGVDSERSAGIACGMEWLRRSDEVWIFAKDASGCSAGMKAEYDLAVQLGKPVVFIDPGSIRNTGHETSGGEK